MGMIEKVRSAFAAACLLSASGAALAQTVSIDGPMGPLQAERAGPVQAEHALVVIPGSGPVDRDGNSPMGLRSDAYRLLAEALAAEGIVTLRIDKRGMFGSAGAIADANDVTLAAYAQDARDWVARAAQDARCVWLAGHSEGGLVALLASKGASAQLCGVILLTAPGRPIQNLLLEQLGANPFNAPLMDELRGLVADLEAGQTRDPKTISPPLQPIFSPGLQRYMIDLFAHDPAQVAAGYSGPALIVSASADMQVRAADAHALAQAMPQAKTLTLAAGTHMLKLDVPGQPMASYTDPTLPLHPDLVPGILAFLADQG